MTAAPTRKKGSGGLLCCGSYKARGARACSNHFLEYDALLSLVSSELRALFTLRDADRQALRAALAREGQARERARREGTERLLRVKERRLRELDALIPEAFERGAQGLLPEALCLRLLADYESERAALAESVDALRARREEPAPPPFEAEPEALLRGEPLSPALVKRFIARIEVGQGRWERDAEGKRVRRQPVRIVYRFAEPADERP